MDHQKSSYGSEVKIEYQRCCQKHNGDLRDKRIQSANSVENG